MKKHVSSINLNTANEILFALSDVSVMSTARREMFEIWKKNNPEKPFNGEKYNVRRYIISELFGVSANTPVFSDAWDVMLRVRKALYNPADLGKDGKFAEVRDRIELFKDNGQTKTTWSEFSAHVTHKHDMADKVEGYYIEKKTAVGDWLHSKTANTFDRMIAEYSRKNEHIRWDYTKPEKGIDIHFEYTWAEFFDILSGYNDKGLRTWFKNTLVCSYNGYCMQMQEIQTSKKKIAYLMQYNNR